jgi:hypothetical protein
VGAGLFGEVAVFVGFGGTWYLLGVRSAIVRRFRGVAFAGVGSRGVRLRIGWDKESGQFITSVGPLHMGGRSHPTELDK